MALTMYVPRTWCEPGSLPGTRSTRSNRVVLNDPNAKHEPVLKQQYLRHIVFGSGATGSLALTVGFFAGQSNARDGCPSKLSYNDLSFKKAIVDAASARCIFRKNTKPPASVFVDFTTSIGVPVEYGPNVYRDVSMRVASAIDRFGRPGKGECPYPVVKGSTGLPVGWKSTIDAAVRRIATTGGFDESSSTAIEVPARITPPEQLPPVSQPSMPNRLPLTPPTTPTTTSMARPVGQGRTGSPDTRWDADHGQLRRDGHRLNEHNSPSTRRRSELVHQEQRITQAEEDIHTLKASDKGTARSIRRVADQSSGLEQRIVQTEEDVDTLRASNKKTARSVRHVADQSSDLKQRIDSVANEFTKHQERSTSAIEKLREKCKAMSTEVHKFHMDSSKLRTTCETMATDMSSMQREVTSNAQSINLLEAADRTIASEVGKALSGIRSNIQSNDARLTSVETGLSNNNATTSLLEAADTALAEALVRSASRTNADVYELANHLDYVVTKQDAKDSKMTTAIAQHDTEIARLTAIVHKFIGVAGPNVGRRQA
ncbi:hypothetical protein CLAFUW4_14828 [Fulvia fulva]|nr:hypothetical protein CLAFUR0_14821 [Fulvia fulva]WPV22993.1 hypothetical protein CLAFUW4_14828 [Fulvia fulva]WPV37957.1 hypothetical protein CLAFUW7_14829 [Fulvia fulva]